MSCIRRCGAIQSPPTTGRSAPAASKIQANIKKGAEVEVTKLGDNYAFDGFVVTSIDYKKIGTEEHPNLVEFSESTVGNEEANLSKEDREKHNKELVDAATFLKNVKFVGGKDVDGSRIYTAESLTIEKAKEEFVKKYGENAKPFFSVFGYTNEAGYIMDTCTKTQLLFDEPDEKCKVKNVVIPVIWPSNGSAIDYFGDRDDNVPEAEKEFSKLIEGTLANANEFKSKNLLCHSMGNRIFRMTANENVKFDNIFMVAADIRYNIFEKDFIESADKDHEQGMNIFKMLAQGEDGKRIGKIYCLYNYLDYALLPSGVVNGVTRLGIYGIGSPIHPEIDGHTENFGVNWQLTLQSYPTAHSYSNMGFAIKYYREKIEKTGNHS